MTYRNYDDPEYKNWRKKIYARDKYTCQWPGCSQKAKLNAHHIYRWVDYPGLRYHLDNGITLCRFHHDNINGSEDYYIGFFSRLVQAKKDAL